jgi:GNAT superfamily N-acetyltransferase
MSFWSIFPGPFWWDCIESLNPCITPPYGMSNKLLALQPRRFTLPKGFAFVQLLPRHAKQVETLLRNEYSIYPRCKISLSEQRIYDGFVFDNWIGVGIFTQDKQLVGCCISKDVGRMKLPHEILPKTGLVEYFCIHQSYRKQGLASCLLEELVELTAKQGRLVHIFLKEGFPLWKLPPFYTSQYIARKKGLPGDYKENCSPMGIGLRGFIQTYTHAEYLPLKKFIANLPYQLSGDSELYTFHYRGHTVYLCMTNVYHRTVPEGYRIGELAWMLPKTAEVPLEIQKLAVETCIDNSSFEIILLDKNIPHNTNQRWIKDASFSWYIFNYNPGSFFTTKPYLIL